MDKCPTLGTDSIEKCLTNVQGGRGGVHYWNLRLYVDDTTEYASDASPPVLEYIMNSNLNIIINMASAKLSSDQCI